MKKILITGATGTNGQALISELKKRNAEFVIATRNVEEANKKYFSQNNIVPFSFDDPSTFEEATKNVDRVFLLGPPLVLELDKLLIPFIDFLSEKNIERVVYLSALGSAAENGLLDFHAKIESKLKRDGFNYTILKPVFFAQNFKNYEWENITERHLTFMPAGIGRAAFVDVHDIAKVAAITLMEDGHTQKTYEITGPELLTYFDAANILSEVLNEAIMYPNPSPEQFKEVLTASGAPEFVADYMNEVYKMIADHTVEYTTDDFEKLTGERPTELKTVLKRDFGNLN